MCEGLMVGFYGVDRTVEMSTNFLSSFHNNQRRCLQVPLPHFKKDLCLLLLLKIFVDKRPNFG